MFRRRRRGFLGGVPNNALVQDNGDYLLADNGDYLVL